MVNCVDLGYHLVQRDENVLRMHKNFKQFITEKIFFSVIFLCPLLVSSQPFLVKGKIVDSLNNPIPYASIFIEKFQIGTNSDIEGYFEISVNNLPATMQVSSIGYENRKVVVADDKTNRLIILKSKNTYLEEVVVSGKKINSNLLIGAVKKRISAFFYATDPFEQIALMINNMGNELYSGNYLLKSLTIKTVPVIDGGTKADGSQQLRLRLYKIKEGKVKVGEDILHKDIFLTPKKNNWYKLEVPYKIHLPDEGFVLALEWIENQKYEEWKSKGVTEHPYGLQLDLSNLKEKERTYYSTWYFDPITKRWGWRTESEEEKYAIPAFRIEISEDE